MAHVKERENNGYKPKAIHLSCDPGHDDALAIILAGYNKSIRLLGIDTVAANQSVVKVTENALQILDVAGMQQVGVVQGQHKALLRPSLRCPEIHGESGLALKKGSFPQSDLKPEPGKAVVVMYERMLAYKKSSGKNVHIVCTGALTNVALLLIIYPEAEELIEQIVLMGGAIGPGNTSPAAEFNIQVDPEAAKVVFESGLPIVMVPLEVTHTALATEDVIERMCGRQTPFLSLIKEVVLYFAGTYLEVFGFPSPPIHDPCAVAYVVAPAIFKAEKMRVDIETQSPLTAGATVCDIYHMSPLAKNVTVVKEMDVAAFWDMLTEAVWEADKVSPLNKAS